MTIKIGEEEYRVRFFYGGRWDGRRETACHILRGETAVARGCAYCSHKDQFSKARGRKLAFARAIQSFVVLKENRLLFWEWFLSKWPPKNGRTVECTKS